jgi:hypothetical protein
MLTSKSSSGRTGNGCDDHEGISLHLKFSPHRTGDELKDESDLISLCIAMANSLNESAWNLKNESSQNILRRKMKKC